MFYSLRVSLILAGMGLAANAGTIEYLSRDAWQAAVTGYSTEDFSRPIGDTASSLDFSFLALTSTGRSSSDSSDHPNVKHVDTSFIDLFANPEGGNFVGTVGRTTLSTSTVTTTNSEWCKNGVCTQDTPVQTTSYSDYSDVRSLEIDFRYVTLNFGFDYVATLSGSSPDRSNHPFRMILTFIDGTTSSLWIGGNSAFPSYSEGFIGISSDLYIASVTLRAADRSLGSSFTSVGGDWTYNQTKPKKGDQYLYNLQETTSSDQSSSLAIANLSATVPEPAPGVLIGVGGLLFGAGSLIRRRNSRKRAQ
jgi:hypothetical protein